MCEETLNDIDQYTIVCSPCESHRTLAPRTDAFLALIQHHIAKDARSISDLAEILGISRRQLGRMLSGRRPLRLSELRTITDLLGIERARATFAIEIIGDWQAYNDPELGLVMQLMKPVVAKLIDRANFPIEPLTQKAEDRLSDWLVRTIITNEEQIRNRRDDFVNLPEL